MESWLQSDFDTPKRKVSQLQGPISYGMFDETDYDALTGKCATAS